jgi:hypothetical protein
VAGRARGIDKSLLQIGQDQCKPFR